MSRPTRTATSRSSHVGTGRAVTSRPGRAESAGVSTVAGDASDIIELQRLAGNQAVAQLVADAPATVGVDTGSRVDLLQLAIKIEPFPPRFAIGLDKVAEALLDLTPQDGRAIKSEYKRRTGWDLGWVITAQQGLNEDSPDLPNNLGQPDRKRLLNLLGGTIVSVEPGTEGAPTDAAARDIAEVTANRYRAEAAAIRKAIEKKQADAAIELIRRPHAERQVLADHYQTQYGESLYNALARLPGRDAQRAAAVWVDDTVTADRLALEGDLERQATADAEARKYAELSDAFPSVGQVVKQRQRAARAAVESRLEGVASGDQPGTAEGHAQGREHLAAVLAQPGAGDQTLATRMGAASDPVIAAIVDRGEPEQVAARLARADVEGTLKAADLAGGIRRLRALARRAAMREIEHQPEALAPQADRVIGIITDGYYQRFADEFDKIDTKRTLAKVLTSVGGAVERERNQVLLAGKGVMPLWQEMDHALRARPRDMETVRGILGRLTRPEVDTLKEEYHQNTVGNRSMEADLVGTEAERQVAKLMDSDEARAAEMEKSVLLQGGVFSSDTTDEVSRLDEERKWTFGRYLALERAVMENKGTFAEARDWVGNLEHDLVERAHTAAADASSAMARALTDSPPDVATARVALVKLQQAVERLDRNVGIYKEATKAAFEEFVDLAVLVVTTAVTMGQGSAIVLALRTTVATIGTKLVLKGSAYSADEFLMDLRSGLGAAAGGKLVEGVLNPVAKQIAAYADKVKLSSSFAGRVAEKLGPAAAWEAEHLITTGTSNLATGQDLSSGMGLKGQTDALIQHGVTTAGKEMLGGGHRPGPGAGGDETAGRVPGEETAGAKAPGEETAGAKAPAEEVAGVPRPSATGESVPSTTPDVADQAATGPLAGAGPESAGQAVAEPRVPMQLPESTHKRPARDEHSVRSTEKEGSPTLDEAARTRPDEPPTTQEEASPGTDDTIVEQSPVENERSRQAREEQQRRAERYVGDQETLRETTAPDARTRALATEFAALLPDWPDLHPTQRLARLEAIVNARLREAGVPHVWIETGTMPAGNAEFSMRTWKITVSEASLGTRAPSLEAFAALADATAHEARHALHMFRGYRAAMANGTFRSMEGISPMAEVAARDANSGHRDAEPLDLTSPAFKEALEVHQGFYGSSASAKRRRQNGQALAKVRYRIRELEAAIAREPPGSPRRAELRAELATALRRQDRVHNAYIASAHEIDAWRTGSSTRAAVIEHVTRERITSLEEARARAEADGARGMARVAELEAAGSDTSRAQALVDEAIQREVATEAELDMLRGQLEALEAIRRGDVAPASEQWPDPQDFDAGG